VPLRLALLAAVLLSLGHQDADVTPEGERERLAAYVEGLDAFTVRYSMFPQDGDPIELRIVYSAPDRALLRMSKPEGTMTMWVVEGVIAMHTEEGDELGFGSFAAGPVFDELRDVREAMHEAFGDGAEVLHRLRPTFHVHPDAKNPDGGPRFSIEMQMGETNTSFFCWNGIHADVFEDVTLEGGHVVLHAAGEDKTLKIAREHSAGFLELAFGEGESGPVTMRLDGLELEADEAELEVPDAPDGARDLDEGLAASANAMAGPGAVRRNLFRRIQQRLESGDREWDDDTRADAAEVFELFHRHPLPAHYETWVERMREINDGAAEQLAEMVERGDVPAEELAFGVAKWRKALTARLHDTEEAYAAKLPPTVEGDWSDELLTLEREVARAVFVETLTTPLLEDFETRVAGQL
jgi:hypothetical protein